MYTRKSIRLWVLAGSMLAGCQQLVSEQSPVSVTPPALEVAPAAPVRAEEITVDNAHEKLRALQIELEQDSHRYSAAAAR